MTRRLNVATAALGLLAIVSAAGNAQGAQTSTQPDARWRAWTGCWTPVGAQAGLGPSATVCVLPTDKSSAVEIVTVVGSRITDRSRVDADGAEHIVSRDGCTGTEMARWSPSGTRVLVTETMACSGGAPRKGTGLMSFDQQYQWLDVRGVSSGTTAGVAVARYQMVTDTAGLPAEVRPALSMRGAAANNAILAASAPLTLADIADVATTTDSGVASAWLVERTRGLALNIEGRQLVTLADQGVPPAVIDVLVAIAHPRVFALAATQPQMREPQRSGSSNDQYWRRYPSFSSIYYSPWYDPFYGYYDMYSPYGYYRYSSYGYSPYGYNPYYGYYPGSQPIIVVNRPSETVSPPHGRVTRGRGYTSGSSTSGESGKTVSGPSSSSSGGSSGSTGSGGSSGGSSSSSGSSGGGDRVAVRKPPA